MVFSQVNGRLQQVSPLLVYGLGVLDALIVTWIVVLIAQGV